MSAQEATQRWQGFLARIEERAQALLLEAGAGCRALLEAADLDPIPMTNAWNAVRAQMDELRRKVETTWNDSAAPILEQSGLSPEALKGLHGEGLALMERLWKNLEEAEIEVFGQAAETIRAHAKRLLEKDHRCRQCGAAMTLSATYFRSVQQTCPFCQRVNTFEPGMTIRAVEFFCTHHYSQRQAKSAWQAWRAAEEALRADAELDERWKAAERALRAYAEVYLKAAIEVVPDRAADFEKDLKGKMAFFYEQFPSHIPKEASHV